MITLACLWFGLWCVSGPLPAPNDAPELLGMSWVWVTPLEPYTAKYNCGRDIYCGAEQQLSCGVFEDARIKKVGRNKYQLASYPWPRKIGGTMCPIGVVFHGTIETMEFLQGEL